MQFRAHRGAENRLAGVASRAKLASKAHEQEELEEAGHKSQPDAESPPLGDLTHDPQRQALTSSNVEVSGWEPGANVMTGSDSVSDVCVSKLSGSVARSFVHSWTCFWCI